MPEISRRQFVVYLVVVVLVIVLGGRALRADGGTASVGGVPTEGFTAQAGRDGGADGAGTSGPSGAAGLEVTTTPDRLLVHVAGAVRKPGVYELEAGARVADAVAKAGGGKAGAALDVLNLAAKVTDGQQVLVARRGSGAGGGAGTGIAAPPAGGSGSPGAAGAAAGGAGAGGAAAGAAGAGVPAGAAATGGATVNVNQADATQLEVLNGVGPAIAAKIVDWRTQNGPFKTVDDLALVPGIGPKKLEAIRAQATT